jgi:hypothetical protein
VFNFHDPTALRLGRMRIHRRLSWRPRVPAHAQAIVRSGKTGLGGYVVPARSTAGAENSGHAMLKENIRPGEPATDFLELGCKK